MASNYGEKSFIVFVVPDRQCSESGVQADWKNMLQAWSTNGPPRSSSGCAGSLPGCRVRSPALHVLPSGLRSPRSWRWGCRGHSLASVGRPRQRWKLRGQVGCNRGRGSSLAPAEQGHVRSHGRASGYQGLREGQKDGGRHAAKDLPPLWATLPRADAEPEQRTEELVHHLLPAAGSARHLGQWRKLTEERTQEWASTNARSLASNGGW